MRSLVSAVLLFASTLVCLGQQPFIRTYDIPLLNGGGPGNIQLGADRMPDGGLVFTDGKGLTRLDATGNIIWSKAPLFSFQFVPWSPPVPLDLTYFNDVCSTSDGNIILVGKAWGDQIPYLPSVKPMAIKVCVDQYGDLLWVAVDEPSNVHTWFNSVTRSIGGKVVVAGRSYHNLSSNGTLRLTRSNNGAVSECKMFKADASQDHDLIHVGIGADSSILAIGDLGTIMKLDSTLTLIWRADHSGFLPTKATGHSDGTTMAIGGNVVAKYDPVGSMVWSRSLPAFVDGENRDVICRPNGNCVVLGFAFDPYPCSYLVELDTAGNVLWSEQYGGPGDPLSSPNFSYWTMVACACSAERGIFHPSLSLPTRTGRFPDVLSPRSPL